MFALSWFGEVCVMRTIVARMNSIYWMCFIIISLCFFCLLLLLQLREHNLGIGSCFVLRKFKSCGFFSVCNSKVRQNRRKMCRWFMRDISSLAIAFVVVSFSFHSPQSSATIRKSKIDTAGEWTELKNYKSNSKKKSYFSCGYLVFHRMERNPLI